MVVRRGVGLQLMLLVGLVVGSGARADIFLHRDANGVLHLSNAPATSMAHRVLRDVPPPVVEVRPSRDGPIALRPDVESTAYDELIAEASTRYGLEFALVKAIVRVESAFDPRAVSRSGARGLMQLMPETGATLGVQFPFEPEQNVDGGTRYLRLLLDRYAENVTLAVAAYNAGPTRVDEAGGIPEIAETQEYVRRVLRARAAYKRGEAGRLPSGR